MNLDDKLQAIIKNHPNTFTFENVDRKKTLKCFNCSKTFNTEAKLWYSNAIQHLDSKDHQRKILKRASSKSIGDFYQKEPKKIEKF